MWFVSYQPVFEVCHFMLSFEVLMRSVLVSDLPSMMSRRGCKPSCVSSWSSGFRALEYDPGAFMMQVRAHREVHCMLGRVACLQGIKDRTNHIIRKGSCLIYIYIIYIYVVVGVSRLYVFEIPGLSRNRPKPFENYIPRSSIKKPYTADPRPQKL